ncbi:MAG: hypothetical protein OXU81_24180 [Gammaproteobacteria bacterium]|nr:hypothetical protein [Gammaproteobacteria bacterium]
MAELEPQHASDYDDRVTVAVKSVLVEIGQVLGSYKHKFAVIGAAALGCYFSVNVCRLPLPAYLQADTSAPHSSGVWTFTHSHIEEVASTC